MRGTSVDADAPIWPASPSQFSYQGQSYDIYKVPIDGQIKQLAIIKKGREKSTFVDPANPAQPIEWTGRWRRLDRIWSFSPKWENFSEAWRTIRFGRLFFNTFAIAMIGTLGTVISSTIVAYGFSRFRIPGKSALFLILSAPSFYRSR
jgi:multiple sugar transport system permease protein